MWWKFCDSDAKSIEELQTCIEMWGLRREMHSCKWMHMVWWCMMVKLMVAMVWTTHFWKACADGLLLGERERVRVTVTIKQGRSTTFFWGGYNWNQLTHGHIDFVLQHKQSAVYCVLFLNVITSSCCIIPPTFTFNYIVTIPLHPQSWGLLPITNKPIKNTPSTLVWLMALTILSVSPQQLRQRCPWCHPECWL